MYFLRRLICAFTWHLAPSYIPQIGEPETWCCPRCGVPVGREKWMHYSDMWGM